jgi:hypothetical protein
VGVALLDRLTLPLSAIPSERSGVESLVWMDIGASR